MNHLKEARLAKGLAQARTAERLGLSADAYARMERGERKRIPLAVLRRLPAVLERPLDELFGRTEKRNDHA